MKLLISLFILVFSASTLAKPANQSPAEYVAAHFDGKPPIPSVYILRPEDQTVVKKILAHKLKQNRFRYWRDGDRTVWILDEVGKTKPITAGYVIDDGKITEMKVLVFRESRGWEVKKNFYRKRFNEASLTEKHKLDKRISNISGATLSVRATKKMARIALYLHQQVTDNSQPASQ